MDIDNQRTFFMNKRIRILIVFLIFSSFGYYVNANCGPYLYRNGYYLNTGFQNKTDRFFVKMAFRNRVYAHKLENFLGGGCGWTKYLFTPDVTYLFPYNGMSGLDINLNFNIHFYNVPVIANRSCLFYPILGVGMINDRFSLNNDVHKDTRFGANLGLGLEFKMLKAWSVNVDFKNTFLHKAPDRMSFSIGIVYKTNMGEH